MIRIGTAAAALLALSACGDKPAETPKGPDKNPLAVAATASLSPSLKIGEAPYVEVREVLRVPGRIEVDEQRVARVGSSVTGRVNEIDAKVGMSVRRGQLLATLVSTELSSTQLGYLKSFSQMTLAERAVVRARQLFEADVIGSAELQRREAELIQSQAEVSAARDQLRVLGMSEKAVRELGRSRRVNSFASVVSSIDGMVIERKVTQGQVMQPADAMFVVADLSSVWLVAEVPERSAELVGIGETVEAEIAALPGSPVKGQLSFVAATVNPETRTVKVRMDLPNAKREYKPAMLATVLIKTRAHKSRAVPVTAVVREENKDFVFVQTGPEEFRLRPVSLGDEHDNYRVLTSGVQQGEKIVLDGAFQLNVERQRQLTQ
jgi:cobalt-zinc-cadmium efflux system membrane fusion protein